MDIYSLSRSFWDWSFENPEKIRPNHIAMYFFAIEHCNRLGWKSKFGFPTTMVMDALGIKSYNTFIKTLNELVEYGFIDMVEKSRNQYSSNIIALSKNDKALDKALDKAMIKHLTKQSESTSSIDIPIYNSTNIPEADLIFPKESEAIEAIPPDTGKGGPLKVSKKEESEFAPEITARIEAATEKIASFFNITQLRQANPWMKIRNFIEHQARNNNLDYLADQFTAYRQLKEKQGFKHTWMNWTGSPSDRPEPYSEGAWTEKNWVNCLKDFQKTEVKNPSPTVSSVDYSKLHEHTLKLARS